MAGILRGTEEAEASAARLLLPARARRAAVSALSDRVGGDARRARADDHAGRKDDLTSDPRVQRVCSEVSRPTGRQRFLRGVHGGYGGDASTLATPSVAPV